MTSDNAPNDNQAAALHQSYHDVLRRRVTELRAFANRCREGRLTAEEIDEIHLRVRSLVGSGATYGYPNVSSAAEPLDQALASPGIVGLKALAALVDGLSEACESALAQQTPPMASNILIFKPPPPRPGATKPVLLMIDDDPAIHDLIHAMFKSTLRIVSAYNGDEAIAAAREHGPDLILLDNYMPGTDGLKLLHRLSLEKNSASTPVIMLTADDEPHQIIRASLSGIADYVIKPFAPRTLADKIHAVMRRMQMTVLVAHGDAVMRELIGGRLRRSGLTVVDASNGRDALELAAARMPELILLDQSMPGMESGGVLHNLRTDRHTRHIPVLFLSADRAGRGAIENLDTGTAEPITIPSSPEKIAGHVIDTLGFESQAP